MCSFNEFQQAVKDAVATIYKRYLDWKDRGVFEIMPRITTETVCQELSLHGYSKQASIETVELHLEKLYDVGQIKRDAGFTPVGEHYVAYLPVS